MICSPSSLLAPHSSSLAAKRHAVTQPTDTPTPDDDEMPATVDFSNGVRAKFYHPDAVFVLPVDRVVIEVTSRLAWRL